MELENLFTSRKWIIEYYNKVITNSYYGCSFNFTAPQLPDGYNWILNTKGHIATDIILTADIAGYPVDPDTKFSSFNTFPTEPKNLQVFKSSGNHPLLKWNRNLEEDISSYKIFKKYASNGSWQFLTSTTDTLFEDLDEIYLTAHETFAKYAYYSVSSVDNTNKESEKSDSVRTIVKGEIRIEKRLLSDNQKELTYSLGKNFPNPFNPSTNINFSLPENGQVVLKLYNILGQVVKTLVDENLERGSYQLKLNASDLPSGMYIYSMQMNNFSSSKKMILTK